ncbi:MAG: hypothetical protein JW795_12080 [Chitinivibrionales bacterium]|nr:hypothetical protein [Chitinivibrionales bacterium]
MNHLLKQSVCIVLFSVSLLLGADMTLNVDGITLILHDDNSWDFQNKESPEFKDDFTVTLNDNRTVKIMGNHAWQFLSKSELNQKENITLHTVNVQGTSTHPGLADATELATRKAVQNAIKKIRASLPNQKFNLKKLENCIRRVEKEVSQTENFVQGKGWTVALDMTLDKGSLLAVLDCESEVDSTQRKK